MKQSDNDSRPVVVLAGPTASGKSQLALDIASAHDITIVCGDARQAIRGMRIGTAGPSDEELTAVPHVGFAIREPETEYSAAEYAEATRELIAAIPLGRLPVIVGGSGLYIQALVDGFSSDVVFTPAEVREHVQNMFDQMGREAFYEKLMHVDPIAAHRYPDKNPRRIQRALEFFYTTGTPISSSWDTPRNAAPYATTWIAVDQEDNELRTRIEQRCAQMWSDGLINETQTLLDRGLDPSSHIMRTIGYAEATAVIQGRLVPHEALQRLVTATWQYAKRQRTWFRRDARYTWINGKRDELVSSMLNVLRTSRA